MQKECTLTHSKLVLRSGKPILATNNTGQDKCKGCLNKTISKQVFKTAKTKTIHSKTISDQPSAAASSVDSETKNMATTDDFSALKQELRELVGGLRDIFTESNQTSSLGLAAITQQLEDANTSNNSGTNAFKPRKFSGKMTTYTHFCRILNIMPLFVGGKRIANCRLNQCY